MKRILLALMLGGCAVMPEPALQVERPGPRLVLTLEQVGDRTFLVRLHDDGSTTRLAQWDARSKQWVRVIQPTLYEQLRMGRE